MSKKENLLILGSSGLVGQEISKKLNKNFQVFTTFHEQNQSPKINFLDVTSSKNIQKVFCCNR